MPSPSEIRGDNVYYGQNDFSPASKFVMPPASVSDNEVASAAAVDAGKLKHRENVGVELHEGATTVTALNRVVKIARRGGIVIGLEAVVQTKPTGDNTVTVDLEKSTAGGAYATVLTTTISFATADTDRVVKAAVLDAAKDDYIDGDHFRLVTTLGGSSGVHAKGLFVTLIADEHPLT